MLKKYLDELQERDQRTKDYEKNEKKYERMRLEVVRNLYPRINYVCKTLARKAKWVYTHTGKEYFYIRFYSDYGGDSYAGVNIAVDRTEDFIFIEIQGCGDISYNSPLSLEEFSEDKLAEKIMEAYRGKR